MLGMAVQGGKQALILLREWDQQVWTYSHQRTLHSASETSINLEATDLGLALALPT